MSITEAPESMDQLRRRRGELKSKARKGDKGAAKELESVNAKLATLTSLADENADADAYEAEQAKKVSKQQADDAYNSALALGDEDAAALKAMVREEAFDLNARYAALCERYTARHALMTQHLSGLEGSSWEDINDIGWPVVAVEIESHLAASNIIPARRFIGHLALLGTDIGSRVDTHMRRIRLHRGATAEQKARRERVGRL